MAQKKFKKLWHLDPLLSLASLTLFLLGTVMVYSASSGIASEKYGDQAHFLKKQLMAAFVGGIAMAVLFFINPLRLKKLAVPAMAGLAVLLALTALTSLGARANHAMRWLNMGGFNFQPSEFAKPALILYVASVLSKKGDQIRDFAHGLLPLLLTVGGILLMILRQPDFGTTVLLALVVGLMIFVSGAKTWHLGALAMMGLTAGAFLVQGAGYRRRRLLAFLHPWEDPQGAGFQIIQSFVAFGRGGFQGQGLGDGTQKLFYLPEAHTDFIFSVIAEELGFLGSLLVVILFAGLIFQGIRLARKLREPFAASLAFGLTMLIGIQAFLHMAVVTGLVPTKGLTLPLVSYGGSSLVVTFACLGVLLNLSSTISMTAKMARRKEP